MFTIRVQQNIISTAPRLQMTYNHNKVSVNASLGKNVRVILLGDAFQANLCLVL